jgi:hypothetical protein
LRTKSRDQSANGSERPRRWASTGATADHIGVDPRTIRAMVQDGRIKQYSLGPRLKRYDLNEIDAALERGGDRAQAQT